MIMFCSSQSFLNGSLSQEEGGSITRWLPVDEGTVESEEQREDEQRQEPMEENSKRWARQHCWRRQTCITHDSWAPRLTGYTGRRSTGWWRVGWVWLRPGKHAGYTSSEAGDETWCSLISAWTDRLTLNTTPAPPGHNETVPDRSGGGGGYYNDKMYT